MQELTNIGQTHSPPPPTLLPPPPTHARTRYMYNPFGFDQLCSKNCYSFMLRVLPITSACLHNSSLMRQLLVNKKRTDQKGHTKVSSYNAIPYFLEISPWRDLISSRCTLRRDFKGGEISRAATSPLTCLAPAFDNVNRAYACIPRTLNLRPFSMRRDFEGAVYWNQPPYRCGEISRAAGFRGNTVLGNSGVVK